MKTTSFVYFDGLGRPAWRDDFHLDLRICGVTERIKAVGTWDSDSVNRS